MKVFRSQTGEQMSQISLLRTCREKAPDVADMARREQFMPGTRQVAPAGGPYAETKSAPAVCQSKLVLPVQIQTVQGIV